MCFLNVWDLGKQASPDFKSTKGLDQYGTGNYYLLYNSCTRAQPPEATGEDAVASRGTVAQRLLGALYALVPVGGLQEVGARQVSVGYTSSAVRCSFMALCAAA